MNQKNSIYNKHFYFLSVLFVIGNVCITAPEKAADSYNFLAFLIAVVIGAAVCFLLYFLPQSKLTAVPIILLSFYVIGDASITFIKFLKNTLLPSTSPILIFLPFAAVLIYIAVKGVKTYYKFALLCGILAVAVILLFFLSTAVDFNIKHIYLHKFPTVKALIRQGKFYFKTVVLPAALLTIFAKENNIKKGTAVLGFGLGCLCLGFTILNSVLLFGVKFAGELKYPYSVAGSTVTFGNLFTRLDGFLYFVYFVTCITKCAVGIFTIKNQLKITRKN